MSIYILELCFNRVHIMVVRASCKSPLISEITFFDSKDECNTFPERPIVLALLTDLYTSLTIVLVSGCCHAHSN